MEVKKNYVAFCLKPLKDYTQIRSLVALDKSLLLSFKDQIPMIVTSVDHNYELFGVLTKIEAKYGVVVETLLFDRGFL